MLNFFSRSSSTLASVSRCGLSRPRANVLRAALASQSVVSPTPKRDYLEWKVSTSHITAWTSNETLQNWVVERIRMMQPERVHLCDGSEKENEELLQMMEHSGMLIKLDDDKRPGSYLARSASSDVARVEERTYICSEHKSDAGPTNNWKDPEETVDLFDGLFDGCMRGRTMYVVPFSMGPVDSPMALYGVEITDSPYVVVNMRMMTRMGQAVVQKLNEGHDFVPCVHSVGAPLKRGQEDSPWPSNPVDKYIVHFPEQRRIWSYGSGYGGNALLGKKCLALRIASSVAREEGWLAEHMLIVGVTNPKQEKRYFAAAFPSACGKTNMAMMEPGVPGWNVECVGDDIAWMHLGDDGRLWAINPEAGFFGVAPGTSLKSNKMAMLTISKNTIFTNCALSRDGDIYWEGMKDEEPEHVQSWLRTEWYQHSGQDAAHPNARFTVSASQCPVIDPAWEDPAGVPISAIIFGGRRSSTMPLIYQSFSWEHGTFIGATMNSETTAAAAGKRGVLRNDPMAMKPFCGYNMADYWNHWLSFSGRTDPEKLPKIFHVNWFMKGKGGKFLWPGFGENIRVVEWIFERSEGRIDAQESPIGYLPNEGDINTDGLDMPEGAMEELFTIDKREWLQEVQRSRDFLSQFTRLPERIQTELDQLNDRLQQLP